MRKMKIEFDEDALYIALDALTTNEQLDVVCELTKMIDPNDRGAYIDEIMTAAGWDDDDCMTTAYVDQIWHVKKVKGFKGNEPLLNVIEIMEAYDVTIQDLAKELGYKVYEN